MFRSSAFWGFVCVGAGCLVIAAFALGYWYNWFSFITGIVLVMIGYVLVS